MPRHEHLQPCHPTLHEQGVIRCCSFTSFVFRAFNCNPISCNSTDNDSISSSESGNDTPQHMKQYLMLILCWWNVSAWFVAIPRLPDLLHFHFQKAASMPPLKSIRLGGAVNKTPRGTPPSTYWMEEEGTCNRNFNKERQTKFVLIIVLFGPTLAAMCKQCAIPETQKGSKATLSFWQWGIGGDFTLPQPRFQAVGLAIQAWGY